MSGALTAHVCALSHVQRPFLSHLPTALWLLAALRGGGSRCKYGQLWPRRGRSPRRWARSYRGPCVVMWSIAAPARKPAHGFAWTAWLTMCYADYLDVNTPNIVFPVPPFACTLEHTWTNTWPRLIYGQGTALRSRNSSWPSSEGWVLTTPQHSSWAWVWRHTYAKGFASEAPIVG